MAAPPSKQQPEQLSSPSSFSSSRSSGGEVITHDSTLSVTSIAYQAVLDNLITPVQNILTSPAIRKVAVSSLVLAAIVLLSLGSAIVAYTVFYYLYVPRVGFTTDIWLQYGQGQIPFANIDLSKAALATDLAYDVIFDLLVPASARNLDLGNFMVDLTLFAADGSIALHSARAASLTWAPPLARSVQTIFRLPAFLLSSSYSPTQRLKIPVVSKRALRTFSTGRITKALVKIGRQDGIHYLERGADVAAPSYGTPGELQIYSATLNFVGHLSGLRWLMYYHRIISFFLFCTVFFFISVTSALVLWAIIGYTSASSAEEDDDGDSSAIKYHEQAEIESVKTEEEGDGDTASELSVSAIKAKEQNLTQDERTRRELQEQARRLADARRRAEVFSSSNTDDDTQGDSKSVLSHLAFDTVVVGSASASASGSGSGSVSDEDAVLVKQEAKTESDTEGSSARWKDIAKEGPSTALPATVKSEGGSATSARAAPQDSVRRRPSSRSLRE